jgi:glycerate 2-kinase
VRAALTAIAPERLVERAWTHADPLGRAPRVWVIAAGKAAPAMAAAATRLLGPRLVGGVVIGLGPSAAAGPLDVLVSSHPVPTEASEAAGRRALEIARAASPGDGLLVLLSGGASAMMAAPAAGVTLEDKRRTTEILLRAGADIASLNTVRKHLSAVKGGHLAAATAARCGTLAISDVVGDDLEVIGSGPTVPDASTFEDACRVLAALGGSGAYPAPVVERLEKGRAGRLADTPKPGDSRLVRSTATVIGGRFDAMEGAARAARAAGYHVVVSDVPVTGEARLAAARHLAAAKVTAVPVEGPLCLVSSGETTVRVTGTGRGGRNQEFALAAAAALQELGRPVALASVGTDGIDGPTDAAGAVADSTTLGRAERAGMAHPSAFLANNDAFAFFTGLGDLIRTGPTGTNVGDLQVLLVA